MQSVYIFWGSLFPHCEPVFSKWHTHLYNQTNNNNKAGVDFVRAKRGPYCNFRFALEFSYSAPLICLGGSQLDTV